jgi:hypothetical protein
MAAYRISVTFERFDDVLLFRLIGTIGVYVIWDSQARAKPTYIGEGVLLKRFADHSRHDGHRFAQPWNGYVARIDGSTSRVHKAEAAAVERLLLDVARDTDRMPRINRSPGSAFHVRALCRDDRLRVSIKGYDPLLPPREARRLIQPKVIDVWRDGRTFEFAHDWRLRRLRRAL